MTTPRSHARKHFSLLTPTFTATIVAAVISSALHEVRAVAGGLDDEGAFNTPRPLAGVNTSRREQSPAISADGRILFFASDRNRFDGGADIFEARRENPNSAFMMRPLEASALNQYLDEGRAAQFPSHVTDGGLALYFFRNQQDGTGNYDIWVARRDDLEEDFLDVRPLDNGPVNTFAYHEGASTLTGDGSQLFFVSNRPGSVGRALWLATRDDAGDFTVLRNLSEINTVGNDRQPTVSADGRLLIWDRDASTIWCATRETDDPEEPFGEPRLLPETVNDGHRNSMPSLAGSWPLPGAPLVFTRETSGNRDIFEAVWTISGPPPAKTFLRGDCNDDGGVDLSDAVCILNRLFLGGRAPGCVVASDANSDEAVDIADPSFLLNHLFLGGPAPGAPFPSCGPISSPDDERRCEVQPTNCN